MKLHRTLFFCLFFAALNPIFSQNLVKNGDCELPLVNGKIPFWTVTRGDDWLVRTESPAPQSGNNYFAPDTAYIAELSQEIDISMYSCNIGNGLQRFDFTGYVRVYQQVPPDDSRVLIDFWVNNAWQTGYDSGNRSGFLLWTRLSQSLTPPRTATKMRIRLQSTRNNGENNNGYYDNLSIVPTPSVIDPKIDSVFVKNALCSVNNGEIRVATSGNAGVKMFQLQGYSGIQTDSVFRNLPPRQYTVSVVMQSGQPSCAVTKTVEIKDFPAPKLDSIALKPATCGNANGQINVTFSGGNGRVLLSLDSLIYQNRVSFTNLSKGNYTVYARDSLNCVTKRSVVIADLPAVKIDSIATVAANCGKDNGKITVFPANARYAYSVDNFNFANNNAFYNLRGGTFSVTLRDSNACLSVQTVQLAKFDAPIIDSVSVLPASCDKTNAQIFVAARGGVGSLTYSINADAYNARNAFANVKDGEVTVRVKDSLNCVVNATVIVPKASPILFESVKVKPTSCGKEEGKITIVAKGGAGDLRYSLDSVNFQTDNLFELLRGQAYRVFVRDDNGCVKSADVFLRSNCDVYVPNAFSPNNDGQNDILCVYADASQVAKVLEFRIFNRWGMLMYDNPNVEINNPGSGWDGYFNEKPMDSDVFVYIIKVQTIDGRILQDTGDITLLR